MSQGFFVHDLEDGTRAHVGIRTLDEADALELAKPGLAPSPGVDAVDSVCGLQYVRVVANNNSVRIGGQIIDIPHKPRGRSYAKAYVVVRHLLDGRRGREAGEGQEETHGGVTKSLTR